MQDPGKIASGNCGDNITPASKYIKDDMNTEEIEKILPRRIGKRRIQERLAPMVKR